MFVGPIVPDEPVKFRNPCLNNCWENAPQATGNSIFENFFRCNFRSEVDGEVISRVPLEDVGVDVFVKVGDSR